MFDFTERIDHGDTSVLGHAFDRLVGKSTQHDRADPALEVVGDVTQAFAGIQALLALIDKRYGATETANAGLKRDPRAQ